MKRIVTFFILLGWLVACVGAEKAHDTHGTQHSEVISHEGAEGDRHDAGGHHGEGPPVTANAPTLFTVFGVPITNSIVQTWIVMGVLFLVIRLGTRHMTQIPSGVQNVIEAAVEGLEEMVKGLLEPKVVRWVFPMIATYFIFILVSNISGLLPGVGSIGMGKPIPDSPLPFAVEHADLPFLRPPTADANTTIAMALTFFIMSTWWALKYNGPVGLVKHVFGVKGGMVGVAALLLAPIFIFIGLIEVVSIMIRPVALAMRLYGNVYGGENVLTIMLGKGFGLAALPFYFLELMVAVVQALVFTVLSIAFIGSLCSHSEDDAH